MPVAKQLGHSLALKPAQSSHFTQSGPKHSGSGFPQQILACFAGAHMHISGAFALAALIPGIFWGWIFARTNSLLAAATSHFLIGGAAIFLFGIEEFVAALTG
jgi:hypothetical protein